MLTLLIGTDWVANSNMILQMIAQDVQQKKGGRILIVPELISHDTERRLCAAAGNTSSCFAEVLTFTRLARRVSEAVGHGMLPCLDDGGRVVAMASAARQLHSKLKAYASVETRPEFLSGLVEAVDEFKRCCITAEDLRAASKQTEGAFAQKLEELSLILEAYDALCAQGKKDPRDQMSWLLEQLEDSEFVSEHTFYIDGFPDFTRQHMAIIEYIIRNSKSVVISINCDDVYSENAAFEKAASTAKEILKTAKTAKVPMEVKLVPPRENKLLQVCKKLFQGGITAVPELKNILRVYQTDSIHSECISVAEQIIDLIHNGARYRDIGVVCTDISVYKNILGMILGRFKIPFYTTGTEDILEKSVIITVLTALDAAINGLEQADVLHYLKSPLSILDSTICDRIENYAIIWNISGKKWLTEWENHPEGLSGEWTDSAYIALRELNNARKTVMEPLAELSQRLKDSVTLGQMVEAVYLFLQQIQMSQRLATLAEQMLITGDNRNAQVLNQLWEILLTALEQLYDVLGETAWDQETFTRLLKLLLSQYTVGTIPAFLDCVMVGTVESMRCQQVKHLFVLGAVEGALPSYGGVSGVLTDQERTALRQMGVPLTGGALDGLKAEFAEIYGVFCGAQDSICVSCPAGQVSYIYRRLSDMAGGEYEVKDITGPARTDKLEAASLLLQHNQRQLAQELDILKEYDVLNLHKAYDMGKLQNSTVCTLYGKQLNLSASQVDRFADCKLAYFLRYGLLAKERKTAEVDPAEFGTYVHTVLEQTARHILALGGFTSVTLEQTLSIARGYSKGYEAEKFSQLDSNRTTYLFQRNWAELELIVQELWQELQQSEFQPVDFEVAFGGGCQMDPICIEGSQMQAQLQGFVDRVDVWKENSQNFFRVVDYKTGKKDFDYCDIFNGLGLQMLLYLFALEKSGQKLLGENPIPAGVQYFPARAPLMASEGILTDEEAADARRKLWKRKGLLLRDEQVLSAMERSEDPVRLSYSRKKDGTLSGDLADRGQFQLLKGYVYRLLGAMVDEIANGNVEANPYTRGSLHNACAFCPYGAVCHPEDVPGRRDYRAMDAQRFWEEIGKEMKKFG